MPVHRAAASVLHNEIIIYEQHISLSLFIHTASLSNETILEPVRETTNHFPGSIFPRWDCRIYVKLNVCFSSCEAHST